MWKPYFTSSTVDGGSCFDDAKTHEGSYFNNIRAHGGPKGPEFPLGQGKKGLGSMIDMCKGCREI